MPAVTQMPAKLKATTRVQVIMKVPTKIQTITPAPFVKAMPTNMQIITSMRAIAKMPTKMQIFAKLRKSHAGAAVVSFRALGELGNFCTDLLLATCPEQHRAALPHRPPFKNCCSTLDMHPEP